MAAVERGGRGAACVVKLRDGARENDVIFFCSSSLVEQRGPAGAGTHTRIAPTLHTSHLPPSWTGFCLCDVEKWWGESEEFWPVQEKCAAFPLPRPTPQDFRNLQRDVRLSPSSYT